MNTITETPHCPKCVNVALVYGGPTQHGIAWDCPECDYVMYRQPDNVKDHDPVNHPQHYTSHPSGVECINITEHMNFCVGNAVKYLWRADLKGGIEDLRKAQWYINREIARIEKKHGISLIEKGQ